MGALICQKCVNGILHWVDDPDVVELGKARMKCETCGKVVTTEKFSRHSPLRALAGTVRGKLNILRFRLRYWRYSKTWETISKVFRGSTK